MHGALTNIPAYLGMFHSHIFQWSPKTGSFYFNYAYSCLQIFVQTVLVYSYHHSLILSNIIQCPVGYKQCNVCTRYLAYLIIFSIFISVKDLKLARRLWTGLSYQVPKMLIISLFFNRYLAMAPSYLQYPTVFNGKLISLLRKLTIAGLLESSKFGHFLNHGCYPKVIQGQGECLEAELFPGEPDSCLTLRVFPDRTGGRGKTRLDFSQSAVYHLICVPQVSQFVREFEGSSKPVFVHLLTQCIACQILGSRSLGWLTCVKCGQFGKRDSPTESSTQCQFSHLRPVDPPCPPK